MTLPKQYTGEMTILLAARKSAAWAYDEIGFGRIGSYDIVLLKTPVTVKGACDVFQT